MDSPYIGGVMNRNLPLDRRCAQLAMEGEDQAIRKLFEAKYTQLYKSRHFSRLYDNLCEEVDNEKYLNSNFGVMITINFDPSKLKGMNTRQKELLAQDVVNKLTCKSWLRGESACLENYSLKKSNYTHEHIHFVGTLERRYSPYEIARFLKRDALIGHYINDEASIDVQKFPMRDLEKTIGYTRKRAWEIPRDHELERVCNVLQINGVNGNKSRKGKR